MRDLLLDVNIVVDICAHRAPFFAASAEAVIRCLDHGGTVWLYAGSVQTMEFVLARELVRMSESEAESLSPPRAIVSSRRLLKAFSADKQWLAALSREGNVFDSNDPEDEQLVVALDRFEPDEVALLTRDKKLLARTIRALSPKQYLASNVSPATIDFIDLKCQQSAIRPQLEQNIHTVLRHGKYIMGPEVKKLEERLADFAGVKHCIGCASGTDALLMALMAMDVGPGDAIFTTPFTFIAAAEVISLLGATPVFVDIDPKTFNIDPDKLEFAIQAVKANNPTIYPFSTNSTLKIQNSKLTPKGIIPVDLFGLPSDYDRINAIAKEHGLFVIEDAAQGFGGEYKGKKAGSLADIGCTSFFPAKPLGCYGDGGAVFTDDDVMADSLRSIRVHGKGTHKYDNARIGLNARLDTLQAAVLNAKFDIFPQEIELRNQVASKYTELLAPCSMLHAPCVPKGYKSAWAQYSLLSDKKDQIQATLKEKGIPTAVYYPKPLHLQTAFAYLGYKEGDMPVSEDCSKRIFSLPMHPYLETKEIERICRIIGNEISLTELTGTAEGK